MSEIIDITIRSNIPQVDKETKSLKQQVKDLRKEFESCEVGSEEYAQSLSKLADAMHDYKEQQEILRNSAGDLGTVFGNLQQVSTGVAAGFSAVNAIATITGQNSDALQKSMVRLQQGMALVQGLKGMEGMGKKLKNLTTSVIALISKTKVATVETKALATAENTTSVATKGLSASMNGLKAALVSTGIGALIVALGLAANAIMNLIDKNKEAKAGAEEQKSTEDKLKAAYDENLQSISDQIDMLEAEGKTKQELIKINLELLKSSKLDAEAKLAAAEGTKRAIEYAAQYGKLSKAQKENLKQAEANIVGYTKQVEGYGKAIERMEHNLAVQVTKDNTDAANAKKKAAQDAANAQIKEAQRTAAEQKKYIEDAKKKAIEAANEAAKKLKDNLSDVEEDYKKLIDSLTNAREILYKTASDDKNLTLDQFDEAGKAARDNLYKVQGSIYASVTELHNALSKQYNEYKQNLEKEKKETIDSYNEIREARIKAVTEEYDDKINNVTGKDAKARKDKLEKEKNEEIKKLKDYYDLEVRLVEDAYDLRFAKIKTAYAEEDALIDERYNAKNRYTEDKLNQETTKLVQDYLKNLNDLNAAYEQGVTDYENYINNVNRLTAEFNSNRLNKEKEIHIEIAREKSKELEETVELSAKGEISVEESNKRILAIILKYSSQEQQLLSQMQIKPLEEAERVGEIFLENLDKKLADLQTQALKDANILTMKQIQVAHKQYEELVKIYKDMPESGSSAVFASIMNDFQKIGEVFAQGSAASLTGQFKKEMADLEAEYNSQHQIIEDRIAEINKTLDTDMLTTDQEKALYDELEQLRNEDLQNTLTYWQTKTQSSQEYFDKLKEGMSKVINASAQFTKAYSDNLKQRAEAEKNANGEYNEVGKEYIKQAANFDIATAVMETAAGITSAWASNSKAGILGMIAAGIQTAALLTNMFTQIQTIKSARDSALNGTEAKAGASAVPDTSFSLANSGVTAQQTLLSDQTTTELQKDAQDNQRVWVLQSDIDAAANSTKTVVMNSTF